MTGGAGRLALYAALLCVAALSGVGEASAASRVCRQLQAELASLGSGKRASPAQVARYDTAIARQNQEMAKARSQARRAGCGFSIFGSDVAACAKLNAAIDRMNDNLDSLRDKRERLASGNTRGASTRLKAQLRENGCRTPGADKPVLVEKSEPNAQLVINGVPYSPNGEPLEPAANVYGLPQGAFRTMCVRTCDGYFFPMSNTATTSDFERDQKNCESACPGTEMQVFYMRGIDGDTATMTSSVDGQPYSSMRTAYLYKKPTPANAPACGCNAARGFGEIGGNTQAVAPQQQEQSPSITSFAAPPPAARKPAESSDPVQPKVESPAFPDPDRKVRVVAPAFLPDPKAAIDLRAPAPKPGP